MSRTVADNAAARSGLDPSVLKKMLPMLAMAIGGYMAKAGSPAATSGNAGGLGGLVGGLLGGRTGGGLAQMLDMNGDGNALDDVLRLAGKR